jgi:hypothetical protein
MARVETHLEGQINEARCGAKSVGDSVSEVIPTTTSKQPSKTSNAFAHIYSVNIFSEISCERNDIPMDSAEPGSASISNLDETQLSELRWNLQDEIKSILKDHREDILLQERILSYNQAMDALHKLESSRRLDPMERLPHEIMAEIFLWESFWGPRYIVHYMLPLTMVSRRWRDFILSEPLFWTFISLINEKDRDAPILLQLQLSQDLPLTIQVNLPLKGWDSIRQELSKHRNRIQTLIVMQSLTIGDQQDVGLMTKDLQKFLDDLGPLPSLKRLGDASFRIRNLRKPYDIEYLLDRFKSLKYIHNIPLSSDDLRVAKKRLNMDTLITQEDLGTIIPISQSLTGIKKIVFPASGPSEAPPLERPRGDFDSNFSFGWRELVHTRHLASISLAFMSQLTSLINLEIHMDLKTICEISSILHRLSKLQKITAHIASMQTGHISLPSGIISNTSVRSLYIYLNGPTKIALNMNTQESKGHIVNNIDKIPQMLLQIMPKIENLHIDLREFDFSGPTIPFSLQNYFNGNSLSFYLLGCAILPRKEFRIAPSVRKLSIYGNKGQIFSLSSSSVKYLQYNQHPFSTQEPADSPTSWIDLNSWPSLEGITVDNSVVEWNKASLQFLRWVNIQDTTGRTRNISPNNEIKGSITSFIKELACNPCSYPSLEEITLDECPEWDILMIMLERRNLLTVPSIKPIKKLGIPSLYPREILKVLCGLLAARWTERPSNKDLSLAGNAEIILDLSL